MVPSNPGARDLKREPQGQPFSPAIPSREATLSQLEKVLSSGTFVHSPQLCRFLRFVVEQELAGEADQLKEYVLGLQVLGKDESFDPRIDTSVRSEARRLRQKLAEYYQSEGKNDAIEIAMPKGSYRAAFTNRTEPVSNHAVAAAPPVWWRGRLIAVYAILAIGAAVSISFWLRMHATVHAPAIAVIPLENLSADPEQEYFSDGITDAVFTDLAKIHGLSVISRTSVMQYKRTKKSIPEIARELKVDYVVEGTVTRVGNRVRISAQLIAAPGGLPRLGGKL